MAEWVQLFTGYFRNKKAMRLRRILGDEADTYPLRLFAYCGESALDGKVELDLVEEICNWKKESGVLLEALRRVEFLDADGTVHGWMERSGEAIAKLEGKKESDRERKSGKGKKSGDDEPAAPEAPENSDGTPAEFQRNSGGIPSDVRGNSERREEKRIEEKKRESESSPANSLSSFAPQKNTRPDLTEEQLQFFHGWESHIQKLSPSSVARSAPEKSDVNAIREICKGRWPLEVVAKAIEWSPQKDFWRERLTTLDAVARDLPKLVPEYEISLTGPPGGKKRAPEDLAVIKSMTFDEYCQSVVRCLDGLDKERWPRVAKEDYAVALAQAQRQAAKRLGMNPDQAPGTDNAAGLPWGASKRR